MLNVVFRGKKIFILWKQAQKNECGRKFNNRIKVAQHHNLESFYQGISFMMSMQSFIFCPMSDTSFEIVMPCIYSYMAFVLVFFVCLLLYQQLYSPWGKTCEAKQPDPARSGFLDPEVSSLSWIIHYNIQNLFSVL